MFKLKKIFNKHNNAPELEVQYISDDSIGRRERVYFFEDSALKKTRDSQNGNPIYYLSYGIVEEMDTERRSNCFRITPDMIFEVECKDSYAPIIGNKFALKEASDRGGAYEVTQVGLDATSDGFFVDTSTWGVNKKVLVRFHCKQ